MMSLALSVQLLPDFEFYEALIPEAESFLAMCCAASALALCFAVIGISVERVRLARSPVERILRRKF